MRSTVLFESSSTGIVDCHRRRVWKDDDWRDFVHWVSFQLDVTNWKARRLVDCAHALPMLPLTERAFEDGLMSLDELVEFTRLATPDDEARLLRWATRVSTATVRDRADAARRIERDEVSAAERERYLQWWYDDEGQRLFLNGCLPAEAGT